MISRRSIDEVLAVANVKDVVEDFVRLKKRGSNYIGLCPFHDEKTPSFAVSPSKNIYKCFGCGKGGNSVQFLMEHEQMSFPDAVRQLAERYGIELEETQQTDEELEALKERESLYLLNQFAAEFYTGQLYQHERGRSVALSYLKERGFIEKTIQTFAIGYAPGSGTALHDHAIKSGYKKEKLSDAGLLNSRGGDFFRNRVIFPIHQVNGKIIAFAGRVIGKAPKQPKYINSPETEVYHKGTQLYGLFQAKKEIRKQDKCFLVEGYTDVMSLHQAGVENVVATSGTALTSRQVKLLKRFTKDITLLYDGDPAGIAAAERGLEIMLEEDVNVRICVLPENNDPDSFVRERGLSGFKDYIEEEEKDFILFKADRLSAAAKNDPIKKADLIRDMVNSIARVRDTIKRSIYVQQTCRMFDLPESLLVTELNKAVKKQLWEKRRDSLREARREELTAPEEQTEHFQYDKTTPEEASSYQEKDIIRILITSGHQLLDSENEIYLAEYILESIKEVKDEFDNPIYQKIIDLIAAQVNAGNIPDTQFFVHNEDEEVQNMAIELSTSPYEFSENWEKRWDIRLQTQKMPEENYVKDSYLSLMNFKLIKIQKLVSENKELIEKYHKDPDKTEDLERHLQIQQELMQARAKIADDLRRIVL